MQITTRSVQCVILLGQTVSIEISTVQHADAYDGSVQSLLYSCHRYNVLQIHIGALFFILLCFFVIRIPEIKI